MDIISKGMVIDPMNCSDARPTKRLGAEVLSLVLIKEVGCCCCCFCLLIILFCRAKGNSIELDGAKRDLGKPQGAYRWGQL